MIRPIVYTDKDKYLEFVNDFYNSNAVSHRVNEDYFKFTFDSIIDGNPFAEGYMIEEDGVVVGYILLAKTFSQEAGGMVMWIEELYIIPEYRGKGIGTFAIMYIEGKCAEEGYKRVRLEYTEENVNAYNVYKGVGLRDLKYKQMYKELK